MIGHALLSGVLSGTAATIYLYIYCQAFDADYNAVINEVSIFFACLLSTFVMALLHRTAIRIRKYHLLGVVNVGIAVLSFASIAGPLSFTLPLEVEYPELFPGLTIPMHFFPAMAFFALVPFFQKEQLDVSGHLNG